MMKLCVAVFLLLFTPTLFAQDTYPQTEFFGAFSDSVHSGWLVSLAYLPADHFGLEGDISGHYGGNDHRHHFNFGPRVMVHTDDGKVGAFAHLLFGASHISTGGPSDTSFSWVLGGAGEYNFGSNWGGRFQVDLVRTHFFNAAQNTGRYSFGVVYRFGQ